MKTTELLSAACGLLSLLPLLGCGGTSDVKEGAAGDPSVTAQDQAKATPSQDAFAGLSDADRSRMIAQQPLLEAADAIQAAVDTGRDVGFAGIVLSQETHTVLLYWAGPPSASVATAVVEAKRIAPVEVRRAAHSLADLTRARDQVLDFMSANPSSGIVSTGVPSDGTALRVGVASPSARIPPATVPAFDPAPVRSSLSSLALGVAVEVVPDVPSRRALTRNHDLAPFYGAARIFSNIEIPCTTGFGMAFAGNQYLLTADHCGTGFWNGDHSAFVGNVPGRIEGHDIEAIQVSSAAGFFYDGPLNGEFINWFVGTRGGIAGMAVCYSGASSGVDCRGQIDNLSVSYNNGAVRTDMVAVANPGLFYTAISGDSGGPVFVIPPGGQGRLGLGLISADCDKVDLLTGNVVARGYCYGKIVYAQNQWRGSVILTE